MQEGLVMNGDQFLIFAGIIAATLLIGWIVFFLVVRHDPTGARHLITGTGFVQNLTVIVVVAVTAALAVIRVVTGDLAGAILSGLAGYVLGSASRSTSSPDSGATSK